jgi:multisubunit Na+/H+ antiporter MnhE subunit
MRLVGAIIILWLLLYQDAALFKLIHGFILGVLQ